MLPRLQRLSGRIFDELCAELAYARPARRPRRILFDHVPKCAGQSLNAYLRRHFPGRKIFHMQGSAPAASVAQFRQLPESKRHSFALVSGHLAGQLLDEVHPDSCKITVLREPVDRIVSHYYFVKRTQSHYLHEKVLREGLSLRDYVEQALSHELSNHYTLHFSGLSREDAARDPDAAVEQALQGLRRYHLVGFQDDMAGFVAQLRRSANLRLPFPEQKVNVTQDRRSVRELDPATRAVIERANALDLRVYHDLMKNKMASA
ncbi:MAG: sulfotransferase family 2 domain-containing protein [Verrucomicrobia bacterium]|jgi:hypothetical protein|nr:sulfotransferase family 2 domain-containing protein [Verrucomicrobiota bacterium]